MRFLVLVLSEAVLVLVLEFEMPADVVFSVGSRRIARLWESIK